MYNEVFHLVHLQLPNSLHLLSGDRSKVFKTEKQISDIFSVNVSNEDQYILSSTVLALFFEEKEVVQ